MTERTLYTPRIFFVKSRYSVRKERRNRMSELVGKSIWVGGVELANVPSQSFTMLEAKLRHVKESGRGEFVFITYGSGSYSFWVGPDTDLVFHYNNV